MQNQQTVCSTFQPQYAKKGNAFIWFGSVAIAFVCVILQGYGWVVGFTPWLAAVGIVCSLVVATWSVWLTKFHDEPGEAYTAVSVVCKIVCVVAMLIAAAVLFDVGRGLGVSSDVTNTRHKEETAKRESLQATIDNPKTGPRARLKATEALANMDSSYLEKPKEDFEVSSPKALTAFGLDMGAFVGTFIAMFCAFVFFPTGKMVAAQAGIDPRTVINDREETKLSQVRTRVAGAQVQPAQSTSPKTGEVPDGMHWSQVEKELDAQHPNVPKGSRVEIEDTLYEFDGKNWKAQGVYGAGGESQSLSPAPEAKVKAAGGKGHLILPPNKDGRDTDSVSRHDEWKVATQSPRVATQSAQAFDEDGLSKVRQALREYHATPGHFHFKVEPRSDKVLIRQMSYAAKGGQEKQIHGAATHLGLIEWAARPEITIRQISEALAPWMEKKGFDLDYEAKTGR